MSNNLGLFNWIREGVRQSVLLGVTDALDSMGTPDDATKLHPALMNLRSQNSTANLGTATLLDSNESGPGKRSNASSRKRLGRSLKDIEPIAKPAPSQS